MGWARSTEGCRSAASRLAIKPRLRPVGKAAGEIRRGVGGPAGERGRGLRRDLRARPIAAGRAVRPIWRDPRPGRCDRPSRGPPGRLEDALRHLAGMGRVAPGGDRGHSLRARRLDAQGRADRLERPAMRAGARPGVARAQITRSFGPTRGRRSEGGSVAARGGRLHLRRSPPSISSPLLDTHPNLERGPPALAETVVSPKLVRADAVHGAAETCIGGVVLLQTTAWRDDSTARRAWLRQETR